MCIAAYADGTINPIHAVMTWFINGLNYTTDIPYMNKTDYRVFIVISTITIDRALVNSYECLMNFAQPVDIQYFHVAMNAPEFNASCSTAGEFSHLEMKKQKYKVSVDHIGLCKKI